MKRFVWLLLGLLLSGRARAGVDYDPSASAIQGQLDDTSTVAAIEDGLAPWRITPQRAGHVNLRNQAGTEVGTAGAPLRVDPTGSTAQPVTGTFFQATQPVSGTVAATQSGTWTVQPGNTANTTAWKVDGSAVTQPVSAASLPLPAGAATSALQTTGNTSLSSIDTKTPTLVSGRQPVDGSGVTQPVSGTFWQATQPVSAASLPLPAGAATSAKQPALGVAGTASSDVITVQGIASMTALKVDGSAVTQPVSAASLPLPAGAATSALQTTGNTSVASIDTKTPSLGQATMANSSPVVISSNQSAVPASQSGTWTVQPGNTANTTAWKVDGSAVTQPVSGTFWQTTQPVSGTVTANQGTAAALSGGWPVKVTDGTNSMPTMDAVGRAGYVRITDGSNTLGTVANPLNALVTQGTSPWLVGTSLTTSNSSLAFGDVTTSATVDTIVRRTAYTEPTSSVAFSIKSASANDTSAGTGARTVIVTYFDGSSSTLSTETVTLNGTTCVNSVTTAARYIEKLSVATAGSGATNAGILTIYTGTGCSTTVGTIGAGENQTFWAHHYVPSGKTCNITGLSVSHNGTTVGSGGVFEIKGLTLGVSNAIEVQVGDFHRLYGQSSTIARTYSSPVRVFGPARLIVHVTPETASSTIYRASIDFFEP